MKRIEELQRKAEYYRDKEMLKVMNGNKSEEQQNLYYFFKGLARGLKVARRVKEGIEVRMDVKGNFFLV